MLQGDKGAGNSNYEGAEEWSRERGIKKEIKLKQFSCASRSSFTEQIERQPWWLSAANISAPFHSSTAKHTSGQACALRLTGITWRLTLTTIKSCSVKNNETYYIHGFQRNREKYEQIYCCGQLSVKETCLQTLRNSLLKALVIKKQHVKNAFSVLNNKWSSTVPQNC